MFDMIIRQGLILDGTAAPGKVADLGIVGDQIAAIGDLSGESAKQEIDARGKVVTPDSSTRIRIQICLFCSSRR